MRGSKGTKEQWEDQRNEVQWEDQRTKESTMGGSKERKNNGRIKGTKVQWEDQRNESTMGGSKGTKEQ